MIGDIRFTYTEPDVVAIRRAAWMGALHWRKPVICFVVVFVFFFLIMFGDELATGGRMIMTDAAISLSAAVLMTVVLFGSGYLRLVLGHRSTIRGMRGNRLWLGERHICWGDDALSGKSQFGNFERPWDTLSTWLDAPGVVLIYATGILIAAIPKRALDDADVEDLRKLLAKHLPERKRFGLIAAKRRS